MRRHVLWWCSLVCVGALGVGQARAQSWEEFLNLCTANDDENNTPRNPVSCASGDDVLAVVTNTSDRRSYATQQFVDVNQMCEIVGTAHAEFDEVSGACKVNVSWIDPLTGAGSSLWVGFGHSLEHGEAGDFTGLLVWAQTLSCDCYGYRPPTQPP